MFSQDGRQQVPGMRMQQQGQVSNMSQQMQPMQMGPGHQQQTMGNMQGPGVTLQTMQKPMGAIGPQHSLNAPGTTQQMGVGAQIRTVNVGLHAQQPMVVKSEVGVAAQGVQMQNPRMAAPNQQGQAQEGQSATPQQQAQQQDRILKFKQLLPQLKECLVNLISVARQNFAANATIDNLEKSVDTSLLPRFDKALEQFYSICNQIEVNLCLANNQISHTLFSMQYTPLSVSQMKDNVSMQVYSTYISTVKQQLAYAKDIQTMLTESSNKILAQQSRSQQSMGQRPF